MILAIAYLLLAVKQHIACWYAAFISTALYTWLYWDVTLYMESALNVYYLAMAVFGWWNWRSQSTENTSPIITWKRHQHLIALLTIAAATLISGYLLAQNTDARLPYADSFTTWASVVTTYMVAKKVLSNWIYWLIINSVGIALNIDRCLLMTALLLCSYQVIAVAGYRSWRKDYAQQAH